MRLAKQIPFIKSSQSSQMFNKVYSSVCRTAEGTPRSDETCGGVRERKERVVCRELDYSVLIFLVAVMM